MEFKMQNINIIQVLSDIGAGKLGSHLGVKWLCERGNVISHHIFENHRETQFLSLPTKYIDNLTQFFQQFISPLSHIYQQADFPVILSGDHSNAIGTISALCHAYPDKRIGVIWIDAHADLHTPYTTPSGNLHGMTLAALIREDNQKNAKHQLTSEMVNYWQELKQLAPASQGILPQDLCFLGLRDYEPQEQALLEQWDIPHYSVETIRALGFDSVLESVKKQFSEVDMVYLSFDVDSIDSQLLCATGTPVLKGFSEKELSLLLDSLLHLPHLKAFEITEFNPTLSSDSEQYEIVYRLFQQSLEKLSKRK